MFLTRGFLLLRCCHQYYPILITGVILTTTTLILTTSVIPPPASPRPNSSTKQLVRPGNTGIVRALPHLHLKSAPNSRSIDLISPVFVHEVRFIYPYPLFHPAIPMSISIPFSPPSPYPLSHAAIPISVPISTRARLPPMPIPKQRGKGYICTSRTVEMGTKHRRWRLID